MQQQAACIITIFMLFLMVVQVSTEAHVELIAYDNNPIVELNVNYTFCKDLDYDVVLECGTTGSVSLVWNSSFFEDKTFGANHNSCDCITSENITFFLIRKEIENEFNSAFTSQLRLPTSVLKNQMDTRGTNQLEVTCKANKFTKRMVLIAAVPGML